MLTADIKPDGPGCVIGIIQDGKLAYTKGFGKADVENRLPFTAQTNFNLASNSKQFTAMAILLLAEMGKLKRTDDIHRYIPELPDYGYPVTINHLLHHTGGIRDYLELFRLTAKPIQKLNKQTMLKLICDQQELNFVPGKQHLYGNSNYFLLGIIVERVAKQPLHAFIRENILMPLGMNYTFFAEEAKLKNETPGYMPRDTGYLKSAVSNTCFYGDGGMLSNIEDLYRWDQNFYHNVLGKGNQTLMDEMQKTGLLNAGVDTRYAAGLYNFSYRGIHVIMHGGGFGSFNTQMIRFPEERLTIICLVNKGLNVDYYCFAIARLFLKNKLKPAVQNDLMNETTLPVEVEGYYFDKTTQEQRLVKIVGNKLQVGWHVYSPSGQNQFYRVDGWGWEQQCTFQKSNEGTMHMTYRMEYITQDFEKVTESPLQSAMLGHYHCPELSNLKLELKQTDGTYFFLLAKKYTADISASFGNMCILPSLQSVVEFKVEPNGQIKELRVSSERLKNLQFLKKVGPR